MDDVWSPCDVAHMQLALQLAQQQLGKTGPNPAVGCVIIQGDRIIGQGATANGGRPHAEAMALAQAKDLARGSTAYVTLEPCAHESARGTNCTSALINAGIARVVCCLQDPDPRTCGTGFQRLRQAGITVEVGLLAHVGAQQISDFASKFGEYL